MFRHASNLGFAGALVVLVGLLAGCTAAGSLPDGSSITTNPTTVPSASSSTQPTTVPSVSPSANQPFQIAIQPGQLKGFSIPGQRVVFLVSIAEGVEKDDDQAVNVSAVAKNAAVSIDHPSILNGQVAEVTVVPSPSSAGKAIEVIFTGMRGAMTATQTVVFDVIEGKDDRKNDAVELRNRFVAWLAENRPEFRLSRDTKWTGTLVSPQWLVVSHYLFFSEEWEMHVQWHIMIAPDDWARIDLRHRFDGTRPSSAFEISSRSANDVPKPIAVPEEIWR